MTAETEYWEDVVSEALEAEGVTASDKQIAAVAGWVRRAHDCHSENTGPPADPRWPERELSRLQADLKRERDMVTCGECLGAGRLVEPFGPIIGRVGVGECDRCRGHGRHDP